MLYTGFIQAMENLESHRIKNFIFQAWKVMEFNCQFLKVIKMKVFLVVWLLQMTKQGQCTCKDNVQDRKE